MVSFPKQQQQHEQWSRRCDTFRQASELDLARDCVASNGRKQQQKRLKRLILLELNYAWDQFARSVPTELACRPN